MNDLIESCRNISSFPSNLVCHSSHEYELDTYVRELERRGPTLFCKDGEGAVDFWDLENSARAFQYKRLKDNAELIDHLEVANIPDKSDPLCRFVFLHAHNGSSREVLKVTREMLSTIMTYHQITPSFLDFLFSFGNQDHANPQDFHYSGFRHETCLTDAQAGPHISSLRRSGRTTQLCYSLRSVERSSPTEWSIRALAAHHTFDFKYGQAMWLLLKGNEFTKKKIMRETESPNSVAPSRFSTPEEAFSSAMSTHEILCNWAGENWRWYINDMEHDVQKITGKTLSLQVLNSDSVPPFKSRLARAETGALVLTTPLDVTKKVK